MQWRCNQCVNRVNSCDPRLIDDEDGKDSRGGAGHTIGGISGIASVLAGVGAVCSLHNIPILIDCKRFCWEMSNFPLGHLLVLLVQRLRQKGWGAHISEVQSTLIDS